MAQVIDKPIGKEFQCDCCLTVKTQLPSKSGRLNPPNGWKSQGPRYLCGVCLAQNLVGRTVSFQIESFIVEDEDGIWVDEVSPPGQPKSNLFYSRFRKAFDITTRLANYGIGYLIQNDVRIQPGAECEDGCNYPKLPPYPEDVPSLYTHCVKKGSILHGEWEGASGVSVQITKTVESNWKKGTKATPAKRVQVLAMGSRAAATYRWPYPIEIGKGTLSKPTAGREFPPKSVNYRLFYAKTKGGLLPAAKIIVPGHGVAYVRFSVGKDWSRQLRDFKLMQDDRHESILGDAKIVGKMVDGTLSRVMFNVFARFPVTPKSQQNPVVATITTGKRDEYLYSIAIGDSEHQHLIQSTSDFQSQSARRWTYCREDLVGQMIAFIRNHRAYIDARSQDSYKRGMNSHQRRRFRKSGEAAMQKADNRLKTSIQQLVSEIMKLLIRNKVSRVVYDDRNQDYISEFRWFEIRQQMMQKCQQNGIVFVHANGEVQ